MKNRVAFLLCLDTAMLLLVCVLECINFTGLQWHQWLGFAFCPVVLLHVVMQWQWFITQFQQVLTPGAWRVRVNAGLNLLLLALMGAVVFSGGFVSRQATALMGEGFGRVRLWSEVHGWLNFVVVVLVGLHLALNWDWLIAALRRRRPERPALVAARNVTEPTARRRVSFARSLGRAVTVLLVASLASGAVYFSMKAILLPKWRAAMERERVVTAGATGREGNQPGPRPTDPPRNRPAEPERAGQFAGTLALTVLVAVVGRYVLRLRL